MNLRKAYEKYVVRSEGCWGWSGTINPNGYASFNMLVEGKLKKFYAHRVAHELFIGSIPDEYHVDHTCKTRSCTNPQHIEAVTQGENNRRSPGRKQYCKNGHLRSDENIYANGRSCKLCRYKKYIEKGI